MGGLPGWTESHGWGGGHMGRRGPGGGGPVGGCGPRWAGSCGSGHRVGVVPRWEGSRGWAGSRVGAWERSQDERGSRGRRGPGWEGLRTWKDLMKVQSSVRTPSARLSSLISLMTRNRRKKALEMRALSSGSCGAQPQGQSGAGGGRGEGRQAGRAVCAGCVAVGVFQPTPWRLLGPRADPRGAQGPGLAQPEAGWAGRQAVRWADRDSVRPGGGSGQARRLPSVLPRVISSPSCHSAEDPGSAPAPPQCPPSAESPRSSAALWPSIQWPLHAHPARTWLSQAGRPLPMCPPDTPDEWPGRAPCPAFGVCVPISRNCEGLQQ